MAIVEPGKGRAIIANDGAGLRITIPARTYLFTTMIGILFVPFWLFGVIAVIYKLVTEPLSGGTAYLSFWLAIWTLGGLWSFSVHVADADSRRKQQARPRQGRPGNIEFLESLFVRQDGSPFR